MRPKCIGVIGGAGPLAGAYLLERIFTLSGKLYGCVKDADFPKVFLISYPFSDMLKADVDVASVQYELKSCLKSLRENGANILAISCNTLHAFLDENEDLSDLIHLPRLLGEVVSLSDPSLVLCSSTSVKAKIHKQFFPCSYPDKKTQADIDGLIDQILRWEDQSIILKKLEELIQKEIAPTVILGCTELSLFLIPSITEGQVHYRPVRNNG